MTTPRRGTAGFTLIEVLIAVSIVGLLAAIAVPVYISQTGQANKARAAADGVSLAAQVASALRPYPNLGTAPANNTSTINLSGSTATITLNSPTPATPATLAIPTNLSANTEIATSGASASAWCFAMSNQGEIAVYTDQGYMQTATSCNADGSASDGAGVQFGANKGIPSITSTSDGSLAAYSPNQLVMTSQPCASGTTKYIISLVSVNGVAGSYYTSAASVSPWDIPASLMGQGTVNGWVAKLQCTEGDGSTSQSPLSSTTYYTTNASQAVSGLISSNDYTLTWNALTSCPTGFTDQYYIAMTTQAGVDKSSAPPYNTGWVTGSSYTINPTTWNVLGGQTYGYKIQGRCSNGTVTSSPSAASPEYRYTVTPVGPGAPTGVTATPAGTQIDVTWTAPSSSGNAGALASYLVQYRQLPSATWVTLTTTAASTLSATATSLRQGGSYDFRVTAQSTVNGTPSSVANAITPITTVPTAATPTVTSATNIVAWAASTCPAGTSAQYQATQSKTNGATTSTIRLAFPSTAVTVTATGTAGYAQTVYINARCASAYATGPTSANSTARSWTTDVPAPTGVDITLGPSAPAAYVIWWGTCSVGAISYQWSLTGSGFGSRGSGATWVTYTQWNRDFSTWGSGSYSVTARCVTNGVSSAYTNAGGTF